MNRTWREQAIATTTDSQEALAIGMNFEALLDTQLTAEERVEVTVKRDFWLAYAVDCAEAHGFLGVAATIDFLHEKAIAVEHFDPEQESFEEVLLRD